VTGAIEQPTPVRYRCRIIDRGALHDLLGVADEKMVASPARVAPPQDPE
jgi:hypothetical protein